MNEKIFIIYIYMFKFITFLKIEQSIHHEPTIQNKQ